jgi:23S rRNA (uracil1939-C5)-methyltransferase
MRAAAGSGELMGTLVVSADGDRRVREATRRAIDGTLETTSFHVNVHPRGDASIFGPDTRHVSGTPRLREEVAGARFLVSPTAFFQTNVAAAEVLVRLVVEAIPSGASVLDLYAGAGLFAIPLARAGCRVVAVESNRAAVADGEAGLRLNRVAEGMCRFVARGVEQALASSTAGAAYDAAVLDPPRDGCSPQVLDALFGNIRPRTAVYVSCNPEALARDLGVIVSRGYQVISLQPVDMFPHTAHVETVVVLTR